MLKTKEFVPSVYYKSSRDFQYLAHLFDLVFNALKTDADLVFSLPFSINSDDQLLDLLTYTFGLKIDVSKFSSRQLRAVCHAAPIMMKNKGSRLAIDALCKALLNADGIEGGYSVQIDHSKQAVNITITKYASCFGLLAEILPYIIPAGMDFNLLIQAEKTTSVPKTKMYLNSDVLVSKIDYNTTAEIISGYVCDSEDGMFKISTDAQGKSVLVPNAGLLSNNYKTVIEEDTQDV